MEVDHKKIDEHRVKFDLKLKNIISFSNLLPQQCSFPEKIEINIHFKKIICAIKYFKMGCLHGKGTKIEYGYIKQKMGDIVEKSVKCEDVSPNYNTHLPETYIQFLKILDEIRNILENEHFHPQKHELGYREQKGSEYFTCYMFPMKYISQSIIIIINHIKIMLKDPSNFDLMTDNEINKFQKIDNNHYEINISEEFVGLIEGERECYIIEKIRLENEKGVWRMLGGYYSDSLPINRYIVTESFAKFLLHTLIMIFEESKIMKGEITKKEKMINVNYLILEIP